VDAICIDQANTQERGHQVSMMRAIYEGARRAVSRLVRRAGLWKCFGPGLDSDLGCP
jgi:hypothetical protein